MSAHDDYLDPDRAGLFDEQEDNEHIKEAFAEHDGPGKLYRSTYKYTACGPSVGLYVVDTCETGTFRNGWRYCDDLYTLGTWEDMDKRGLLITGISVSSIVEGVEATTDTIEIDTRADALADRMVEADEDDIAWTLARLFDEAVQEVNKQASDIWDATHGCDTCQAHWVAEAHGDGDGTIDGAVPVWSDCPDCEGAGVVI